MSTIYVVCLLILTPTAPGEAERRYELQRTVVPSVEQCRSYAPRYEAECRANPKHARDLRLPGARVVTTCQESK